MKKVFVKFTSVLCLASWMLVQVPFSLFHHHEETCSISTEDGSLVHFHEDDGEACFGCSLTLIKSVAQLLFEDTESYFYHEEHEIRHSCPIILRNFHSIRGRAPPLA